MPDGLTGLWWRDKDFVPPYREPNGEDCYWSRGNGRVVVALVRTLDLLPVNSPYRAEYTTMLQTMAGALRKVQRADGFWNVSLHDPTHFGGKEASGTAMFVAAMAWGVRQGVLPRETYLPVVARGWNALATEALHPDGFLGYVQGTGKEPKDGQPVTYTSKPDFTDYGLGAFLLAGTEVIRLAGAK
jgi:rhamnogalacturonyl hydrolase YesR